jgi:hypothetical protein
MASTVDHPATLPRHHLEAEVVHLRKRIETLKDFIRSVKLHPNVPVEVRRSALGVLST